MNDERLENLVKQARQTELPDCPDSVEHNVLRRIRLHSVNSNNSGWDWFISLLQQPGFIAAVLTMVAVVSSGATIISTQSNAADQNRHLLAASALDFNVFQFTELLNYNQH